MREYSVMIGGEIGVNETPVKPDVLAGRLNTHEKVVVAVKDLINACSLHGVGDLEEIDVLMKLLDT